LKQLTLRSLLRIQCDRQTGKPAGFGFCEFADAATAQSAIRNLNNKEFHGRTLRVDLADQERRQVAPEERTRAQVGEQLEAVSRVVTAMSLSQRHDVLAQMQAFAIQQPALAYQLLTQFPQLAHALLDAQVSLGTVRGPDLLAVQQLPPPVAPPPVAGAPPVQPFPAAMAPPMAHPMQQQWPPVRDFCSSDLCFPLSKSAFSLLFTATRRVASTSCTPAAFLACLGTWILWGFNFNHFHCFLIFRMICGFRSLH
jgi:cleavage stimulation factor subunit 2